MHWIPDFQFCSNSHKKVITKISCHCDLLNSSCSSYPSYKRFLHKIATVPAKYCLNHEQSFLSHLILFTRGDTGKHLLAWETGLILPMGSELIIRGPSICCSKKQWSYIKEKRRQRERKSKVMFSSRKSQSFKRSSMIYS